MIRLEHAAAFRREILAAGRAAGLVSRPVRVAAAGTLALAYEEGPGRERIDFSAPAFVLGRPVEPACLRGVGEGFYLYEPRQVFRVRNARVVGWRALLLEDGGLVAGGEVMGEARLAEVRRSAERGYEGYLLEAAAPALFHRPPVDDAVIEGVGVFVGALEPGNYGAFLMRVLPGLLMLAEEGLRFDYIVVPRVTPWLGSALAWLGLGERVVLAAEAISGRVCRELLVVREPESEGCFDPVTLRRIARIAPGPAGPERIYVSRQDRLAAAPGYRPLVNELEIEAALRGRGYAVVLPERLGFAAQVGLFSGARCVVGPSGSGMLNAVFAPEGAGVVDLESYTATVRQHAKVYASSGKRFGFVFGSVHDDPTRGLAFRDWEVSVGDVLEGARRVEAF